MFVVPKINVRKESCHTTSVEISPHSAVHVLHTAAYGTDLSLAPFVVVSPTVC
jgi:hypothetical protein